MTTQQFLTTPKAAVALGISTWTLRRWTREGQLERDVHWKPRGPFHNSVKVFDIEAVRNWMGTQGYDLTTIHDPSAEATP